MLDTLQYKSTRAGHPAWVGMWVIHVKLQRLASICGNSYRHGLHRRVESQARVMRKQLLQMVFSIFRNIAADTAVRCGAAMGILAWRLGVRRRLAARGLSMALGIAGPARARLIRRSYATMGANFMEIWTAGGVDGIERHAEPANPAWMRHVQAQHRGIVLATLHLGSWDGAVIGGRRCFTRVLAYAKAQHSPGIDEVLNRCRSITGAEVLLTRQGDRTGAVTVMKALRNGGAVGLLADQRPRTQEGVPAEFLGQAAWCHPGPAFFAQRAKVWIVPAFAIRVRAGLTRTYVLRPFSVEGLTPEAATQRVMDVLSALIAAFPGQYFWHHRRFIAGPDACTGSDPRWRTGLDFLR